MLGNDYKKKSLTTVQGRATAGKGIGLLGLSNESWIACEGKKINNPLDDRILKHVPFSQYRMYKNFHEAVERAAHRFKCKPCKCEIPIDDRRLVLIVILCTLGTCG
jgi:hypothetical protein